MKTHIAKRVLCIMLTACMLATSLTLPIFAADTWSPTETTRIYVATDSGAVDVNDRSDEVMLHAHLFAKEYQTKLGEQLVVAYGAKENAHYCDIILEYDPDLGMAKESFSLNVYRDNLIITASDTAGLFYGYREVLKQLLVDNTVDEALENKPAVAERALSLDNGRKYFSPEWIKDLIREMSWAGMNTLVVHFSEEMGLGLESKTYPWLAGRDGSLCVQAYLTDADHENFDKYLTQEELRDIAEFAKMYHVQLVPSFDSPGHLNYIVKCFNTRVRQKGSYEFTYNNVTYKATYSGGTYTFYVNGSPKSSSIYGIGNYLSDGKETQVVQGSSLESNATLKAETQSYSRGIDISNPVAVAFIQSLMVEYGNLFRSFGATTFEICADELLGFGSTLSSSDIDPTAKWADLLHWQTYAQKKTGNSKAVAYDAYLLYVNELNDLAKSMGYDRVRMSNDEVLRQNITWNHVVELDTDIDVSYWDRSYGSVTRYADAGHKIYNILCDYTYYVLSNDFFSQDRQSFTQVYPDKIYNDWSPFVFDTTYSESVTGAAFCIWCDHPTLRTEEKMMTEIKPLLRAIGTKSWNANANKTKSYSTYTAEWTKIGDAPKVEFPDDTAVQAAINEFYNTYLPKQDTYTASSFSWYASEVANAESFLGPDTFRWNQDLFNNLVEFMEYARDDLDSLGDTQALVNALATYDQYKDHKAIYSPESWSVFEASYLAGQKMLEGRNYTADDVNRFVTTFEVMPIFMLDLEANVAPLRQEAIQSAGLMSSRVYQGGRAKVSVIIPRGINVAKVIVVDENGIEVAECVAQPLSIRKPKQVTYFGYIPADELGVHTYTAYAVFSYDKFTQTVGIGEGFLYCSDPVKLTLRVVE